ncbi:MAG: TIGR03936 family radical SAM-associated protein [Bacillota bacterium]
MRSLWRFRLAKRGRMRFLSHLDLMRTVARAFRRAGLRLVYSEGYHPHPLFSFGPALAVGIESEAEYFDALLQEDPGTEEEVLGRLNAVLPEGLFIRAAGRPLLDGRSLAALIDAASYSLWLAGPSEALKAFPSLLRRAVLPYQRHDHEGKTRDLDLRPLLLDLFLPRPGENELRVLGVVGSKGNLRPEELTRFVEGVSVVRVLRTGLYHRENDSLREPISGEKVDWKKIDYAVE